MFCYISKGKSSRTLATLALMKTPVFLIFSHLQDVDFGLWTLSVSNCLVLRLFMGRRMGCNMAVKQIQKGLTGLHLISRMLKVRLKQICGK